MLRFITRHPRRLRRIIQGAAAGTIIVTVAYYWPEVSFGTRAFIRVTRTAATVSLIAADYQYSIGSFLRKSKTLTKDEEKKYEEALQRVHKRTAGWLLWLFETNGGIYIKLGQHLATLDFILPAAFTITLSRLFNQAPTSSPAEVDRVIMEELGIDEPSTVFSEFEWPPVGAASLAQVHKARLRNTGEQVAVKIQHKRLQGFADVDIVTAAVLVKMVKLLFPKFEFTWLADELKINLPKELDFETEGHSAERTAKNFRASGLFQVPKVHWRFTRKRLLVMEYCHGAAVNDVEELKRRGFNLREVSDRLTKAYSEMIFVHGFVHCDPHPGNILVAEHGGSFKLVLLDHGLYRDLSDDFRLAYARLWKALVDGDERMIAKSCGYFGGNGTAHRLFSSILTHRSWERIRMRSLDQPRTLAEIEAIRVRFPELFEQVTYLLARVPRPLLLLLKTNDLLRSIDRALLADERSSSSRAFLIMARYCASAIYEADMEQMGIIRALFRRIQYALQLLKYRSAELILLLYARLT